MKFSEKLRASRMRAGLSQSALAVEAGISKRMIIYYEQGVKLPRTSAVYEKLAKVLHESPDYFLDAGEESVPSLPEERFIEEAGELYGGRGRAQAKALAEQLGGLFAGGTLTEEDKDAVMKSLTDAYFISKLENRKYAPKKKPENADAD